MLTQTKLLYLNEFRNLLSEKDYDYWKQSIDLKSIWGSKFWQVQGTEALHRACLIPTQILYVNSTIPQTTCRGLASIKNFKTLTIPTLSEYTNWNLSSNLNITELEQIMLNSSFNVSSIDPLGLLMWPINADACQHRFYNTTPGSSQDRPDLRFTSPYTVTTYSVGKLCQQWLEHSSLDSVKHHLSELSDDINLSDFILGPRKPRQKRFIFGTYMAYN